MKKFFIGLIICIFVCCLIIFALQNSNTEYQVSELIPSSYGGMSSLKGTLKNISNNDCKKVQINIEISSGSIKENGWIWVDSPNQSESVSFDNVIYGVSKINNIENYKIKFKNVECWIKKDTK